MQEQNGVGNDLDESDDTSFSLRPSYDVLQLNDFLNRAGAVVLSLLEEKEHGGTVFQNDVDGLSFSDGFVKLSVHSVTFLATRPITIIHYSNISNKILLTIHAPVEEVSEIIVLFIIIMNENNLKHFFFFTGDRNREQTRLHHRLLHRMCLEHF